MLGRVVTPIVNVIDVDGIVQRIDVNDLVDRIDWNELLDNVDFDRVLEKVDVNKVLQRVDLKDLMERAEIPAIVARSTSGIFSPLVDAFRSQVVMVDQAVQCSGCVRRHRVPPAPGRLLETAPHFPKGGGNIAVAVQERYSGTFSRGLSYLMDQSILTSLFFLVILVVESAIKLATHETVTINGDSSVGVLLIFLTWQFAYYASALAATGKTPGKAIMGLKVVNYEDGTPVTTWRAIVRTILLPIIVWSVVGVLFGIVRKDRRELHDLIAGTGVVYSWDATLARYRQEKVEESQTLLTTSIVEGSDETEQDSVENNNRTAYRRHFVWAKKRNSSRSSSRQTSQVMHL
ncbi:RDD family [Fragilaria crotonensis]|nr:RDD family [Fragilaria crotonensis]